MTKLGITPGVHGDGSEEKSGDIVNDSVKVDPKVFTVLQPTVIPIQAPPAAKPRRSIGGTILRGILLFLLFITCFTAGMVLIYGADTIFSGIYGATQGDQNTVATTAVPPQQFGLVNPMGNDQKVNNQVQDDEVRVFFNSVPLAKVMVIEGGNTPDANIQQKEMIDRPMHPYEQQPMHPYEQQEFDNNRPMMPPPMWIMQARQMERAQAIRQMRWRRLQQAIFEQQMMREAMARAEWAQQAQQAELQQRAAMEEQLARAIAHARWEQMQRARAMEEYQAEMQRAQWEQAQRANWERMQMLQQQQMQQQQRQQQQQQQQQQQPWWARHQQQQQQFYQHPQQFFYYPQQQAQQQQQQQQFYQQQQQFYQNQQPQWNNPQQQAAQQQMLTRPHDASPAQILSMQQPAVPPAPEMGMHDKIYQEMQKKSQSMEFNFPSKPIWTAITPTPETPGNYDHDAIFQENLKKINEMSTTVPSVSTVKVAEIKQVEGENMFRDILSVFDEAEKKVESAPNNTQNVFKPFEDKSTSTEAPTIEKEPVKDVVDSAAQVDIPAENVFKTVEEAKPEPSEPLNVFKTVEEQKPEPENVFRTVEEQRPEEGQIPEEDSEGPAEPVVIEDRFPRIGARTTVPVEATTPVADVESDEDMEHDPLAAFLRYFEQEAQKMRVTQPKTAIVDSEVRKEDPMMEQPAAVDVPEPHFQEFQHVPRLVTV